MSRCLHCIMRVSQVRTTAYIVFTFAAVVSCFYFFYRKSEKTFSSDPLLKKQTANDAQWIKRIPLSYENATQYFEALGYRNCERQSQAQVAGKLWMHLRAPISDEICSAIFGEFVANYDIAPEWPPPKEIPGPIKAGTEAIVQQDRYLLHGRIKEATRYFAQRFDGAPEPLEWSPETFQPYLDKAKHSSWFNYAEATNYVYKVLEDYPLTGQTGMVIGSQTPWLEAILLTKGKAAKLLTVEFQPIISTVRKIEYLSPREFSINWKAVASRNFDFVFTFSSLEHTGLGRYGDRLDPEGDLKELRKLSCVLRDGALVFLGLPIGADALVWNAHRIYGPWRLPLMTANFEVLGLYTNGRLEDAFAYASTADALPMADKHGIIVMRNAKENAVC